MSAVAPIGVSQQDEDNSTNVKYVPTFWFPNTASKFYYGCAFLCFAFTGLIIVILQFDLIQRNTFWNAGYAIGVGISSLAGCGIFLSKARDDPRKDDAHYTEMNAKHRKMTKRTAERMFEFRSKIGHNKLNRVTIAPNDNQSKDVEIANRLGEIVNEYDPELEIVRD